uniref:Uncharacterized protein n=1 Tax=Rhizophora mucronata TaxID=61149 RepID=A0A2P2ILX8_RHIMU
MPHLFGILGRRFTISESIHLMGGAQINPSSLISLYVSPGIDN